MESVREPTPRRPLLSGWSNPFTLKVGQMVTGFGVGCGIGIGFGRPVNLRSVPAVGQALAEVVGTIDQTLAPISRPLRASLRRLGAKGLDAGIGCGVGVGRGWGVGISLKPGATEQLVAAVQTAMARLSQVSPLDGAPLSDRSQATAGPPAPARPETVPAGLPATASSSTAPPAGRAGAAGGLHSAEHQEPFREGVGSGTAPSVKEMELRDAVGVLAIALLRRESEIQALAGEVEELRRGYHENVGGVHRGRGARACIDCRRKHRRR